MPIQNLTSAEIIKFHESGFDGTSEQEDSFFGKDGFTFGDIIDAINPLQHIPVVNSIYRKLTGDTIAPSMQIAGDALFGGPIGAALSMAKAAIKSHFNRDYIEPDQTTINATALANSSLPARSNAIGASDYSIVSNLKIDPITKTYAHPEETVNTQHSGSIGPAITIELSKNDKRNGTEKYIEIVSSAKSHVKNIDLIIGKNTGAG